jgi:hypothetical protein
VDPEDLVQAGHCEDLEGRSLRAHQREVAIVFLEATERADQHPEPARIHESHLLEVHDQRADATIDERGDAVTQSGGRVQVDLADDVEDRPVAFTSSGELEFDRSSPSRAPAANDGAGPWMKARLV